MQRRGYSQIRCTVRTTRNVDTFVIVCHFYELACARSHHRVSWIRTKRLPSQSGRLQIVIKLNLRSRGLVRSHPAIGVMDDKPARGFRGACVKSPASEWRRHWRAHQRYGSHERYLPRTGIFCPVQRASMHVSSLANPRASSERERSLSGQSSKPTLSGSDHFVNNPNIVSSFRWSMSGRSACLPIVIQDGLSVNSKFLCGADEYLLINLRCRARCFPKPWYNES